VSSLAIARARPRREALVRQQCPARASRTGSDPGSKSAACPHPKPA
jgi:hypothetical protein